MENIDEIESFLYPACPPSLYPQKIWADEKKTGLVWIPGRQSYLPKLKLISSATFTGWTGKTFAQNVLAVAEENPYLIWWLGIDVDRVTDESEMKRIARFISSSLSFMSIRLSSGGHGLHLLTRIEPIEWKGRASTLVQNLQSEWVKEIRQQGIFVCKYDSRPFYLIGGLNSWIKKSEEIIRISIPKNISSDSKSYSSAASYSFSALSPLIQRFLNFLASKRIKGTWSGEIPSIQSVYLRELRDGLAGSKYRFVTQSPCQSPDWHVNGWVSVCPTYLSVKGFADEKNCLELYDDDF